MKKITLLFITLLISMVGYSQFPTPGTEGFEGTTGPDALPSTNWTLGTGAVSNQWAVFGNGVGLTKRWTITSVAANVYAGANAAFMDRENIGAGNTSEDYLATPLVTVPANGQLRFWTRSTLNGPNGTDYLIKINTNTTAGSQTTIANYNIAPVVAQWTEATLTTTFNVYEEKIVDLTAYAGQQIYIAFIMKFTQPTAGIGGDRWLIDDVKLVERCLDPTGLSASGITQSSANLSWTSLGGATSWEVEVLPSANIPTGTGVLYSGALPYVATGLNPSTPYVYYVRSVCSNSSSNWVGPFNFTTTTPGLSCVAPITIPTLPYSTTDDTLNYSDSTDTPQPTACAGTATNYMTGNDVFYSYTPATTGAISITMTPNANWSGIFVYQGCANVGVTCVAGVANNGSGIRSIPSLNVTAGLPYIIVISTNAAPQTVGYNLIIQQLNCAQPTNLLATSITLTGANLSWDNPGGATSWEYVVQAAGANIPSGSGTQTNSNSTNTITGLNPDTSYQYWVRADCGNGTFSAWAGPFLFNTLVPPPVCGGVFTDAGGASGNYVDGADSTVTICPDIVGQVVTVSFTSFNTQATFDGLYVFNGNSTTAPQFTSVNPAGNVPGGLAGAYWGIANPGSFTSSSPDGCLTFRFRSDGTTTATGWTADVTCGLPPTCPKPLSISASAVLSSSASVSWTEAGTASAWQVLALPCGSPTPTSTSTGWVNATSNPFNLTGLTSETCYDIYVRSECSVSDLSNWTGPVSITTTITPPACGGTFSDPGGSIANYDNNTDSTVTICPSVLGEVVTVTFTQFNTEATWDGLYVFDGNSIAANQIASTNPAGNVPGGLAGSYWGTIIPGPFTSTSPDGCLTFRFRSDASVNNPGWVADVTCGLPPTCPNPNTIVSSVVTSNSVDLSWINPSTATSWNILALPCGSPAPTLSSTGFVVANSNPFTLTGLTPDTCYDIYVRGVCPGNDFSGWAGPKTITTQIAPPICGGTFTDLGGVSANYANSTDNTVTICPTIPGEQVTVTFTFFDTETNWDGLYVFDGNSIAAPLLASANPGGNVPGGLPGSYWGNLTGINLPGPFTASSASGCLTFRFRSDTSVTRPGWEANVTCAPPPTCPKPTAVIVSGNTQTGATISWTEIGSATTWEVIILPAGSPAPTASSVGIITTSNPYVATGLTSGTSYVVYVRGICSASDISLWSNPTAFTTIISNDECSGAISVPVNPDTSCGQVVPGTVIGATASSDPSTCGGSSDDDVWFSFVATSTSHYISLNNITGSTTDLFHVLYTGSCGSLTEVYCSDPNQSIANGLVIGQTYYIKVYTNTANPNQTSTFNVCIGTIPPPIATNDNQYTTNQLIEDVLFNSSCASVTNVTSSTGTNFGSTNGIGYFTSNGSGFPFANGVVLTSGNVLNAPGPNDTTLGDGNQAWVGDTDLEAIILAATGQAMNSRNASKIEFDFVPLVNTISFDFIFASEEYGTFQCSYSDAFAFLLTDIATGVTTNLAVIPNTTTPISVVTIRDQLFNNGCASSNAQYFGDYYQLPQGLDPLGAPTDFNGSTVPMTATSAVIPGHQYHIKLVVADRQDNILDSAVFLKGGSFNFGLELGIDFLISSQNALCPGSVNTLVSNLDPTLYSFQWTENGTVLTTQTGPTLDINQSGTYSLTATLNNTTCAASDTITIEYYPTIIPGTPTDLIGCGNNGFAQFNLNQNSASILGSLAPADFTLSYYLTSSDANNAVNPLPLNYTNTVANLQTIYVRIQRNTGGCYTVSQFNLIVNPLINALFTTVAPLCIGATAPTLATTSDNAIIGTWSPAVIDTNLAGTTPYVFTPNANQCSQPYTMNVTINSAPTPTAVILTQPTCITPTGTVEITSPLSNVATAPTELFISEVTDAETGSLTYVEIYNATGVSKDLSNYKLKIFNNGNTLPSCDLSLSGIIANNSTNVIKISADPNQVGVTPDQVFSSCGGVNNNDNIRLTTSADVDVDNWGRQDGVVYTPANLPGYTYRRLSSATPIPNTTWNAADWTSTDPEDYSNIGTYAPFVSGQYSYNVDSGTFQSNPIFTGLGLGSHVFMAMDINTGCLSEPITVTFDPLLQVNPVTTFSYTSPVCANVAPTLTPDTSAVGFTAGGTFTSTTGLSIASTTGIVDLTTSTPGTYVVTYSTLANPTFCTVAGSSTYTLVINSVPTVTVNSPTVCQGQVATVVATPGSAATYSYAWTVPSGATAPGDVATFTTSVAGTYSVIITNTVTGCVSLSASGTVTINALPTVTVNNSTVCQGQVTTLTATPGTSGTYTYTWTTPSGMSNPGNVATFTTTLAGTYTVSITSSAGCTSAIATSTVVINATPVASVNSVSICQGGQATLTASVTVVGSYSYAWTVPSGASNPGNVATFSASVAGNYSVVVTNTATGCVSLSATGTVTFIPAFDFDIIGGCLNNNYIVQVVPVSNSFDATTAGYAWTYGALSVGTNSPSFDVTTYTVSSPAIETLPLTVSVTVTTVDGCQLNKSITLDKILCDIQKGISPNNDGLNDFFDLEQLNVQQLNIFNRYGTKVYSKFDYTNQWIGQSDSGNELPTGTYYYVIEFKNNQPTKTGWIYINRETK